MSADNWRVCPKCKRTAEQKRDAEIARVGNLYGTIPAEEYITQASEAAKPIKLGEDLREDYELWINATGEFYCGYRGACQQCDFEYSFEHRETLSLDRKKQTV